MSCWPCSSWSRLGEGRFRAQNFSAGPGGVVFGGQLLAQTIVAGATVDPTKDVRSVHTVFARGGLARPAARHRGGAHARRPGPGQRHGHRPAGRPAVHAFARALERGGARPHPPRAEPPTWPARPTPCRRPRRATSGRSGWSTASTWPTRGGRAGRALRVEPVPRGRGHRRPRPGPPLLRHRRLPHRHGHAAPRRAWASRWPTSRSPPACSPTP